MIERRRLKLVEVTRDEFIELKKSKNLNTDDVPEEGGFGKVVRPIGFPDYESALEHFIQTPSARYASVRVDADEWINMDSFDIGDAEIEEMAAIAREKRFLVLGFHREDGYMKGYRHEVDFISRRNGVVSARVHIPGVQRNLYNWQGSDTPYRQITGVYIPISKRELMYKLLAEMVKSAKENDADRVLKLNSECSRLTDYKSSREVRAEYDKCRQSCVGSVTLLKHHHEKLVKDAEEIFSKLEKPL
ncbi:hypothetical protein KY331_03560 [Candidatus Woesearchaeota archaeon]|nr:hypothetical protein [Candidatus Woesearchaeota archaeon]